MVDVIYAEINANGSASTVAPLSDNEGKTLVMVAFDRSGGASSAFIATSAALQANMSEAVGLPTLSGDSNARRSMWLWSGLIPNVGTDRIIDMNVLDGGANSVDCSWMALILDMDDTWSVVATSADDNLQFPGTSLPTGTTFSPDAGPTYTIAAIVCRGDTTVAWDYSTSTPANPGGGTWDLNVNTAVGSVNSRRGNVGVFDWGNQPSQTYEETATLGTARMATAVYAVFVQSTEASTLQVTTPVSVVGLQSQQSTTAVVDASTPLSQVALTAGTAADSTVNAVTPLSQVSLTVTDAATATINASTPPSVVSLQTEQVTTGTLAVVTPLSQVSLTAAVQLETTLNAATPMTQVSLTTSEQETATIVAQTPPSQVTLTATSISSATITAQTPMSQVSLLTQVSSQAVVDAVMPMSQVSLRTTEDEVAIVSVVTPMTQVRLEAFVEQEFKLDQGAWPAMLELVDCLCNEIRDSGLPKVCFCGVLSGSEPPLDYCDDGQAWVRLVTEYPSTVFPLPEEDLRCTAPLAFQLEVGIGRCAPQMHDASTPPTMQEEFDATQLQMADKAAILRAIRCCFQQFDRDEVVLGRYTPFHGGDCLGGFWTVTISELRMR